MYTYQFKEELYHYGKLTKREREILDAIASGNTEPISEPLYLPTWNPDYDEQQETEQAPETAYTGSNCLVMLFALGSLVADAAGAVAELLRYFV